MSNSLIRKLEHGAGLTTEDRALLQQVCAGMRQVGARRDLVCEGDQPSSVHLVLSGMACRYKVLENGNRQITALLVPGDICHPFSPLLAEADHSLRTLSACSVAAVPQAGILDLLRRPNIAQALWWSTLVEESISREWLANIGQREAGQRLAHLLCELHARLQAVGLAGERGYDLPLTQFDLADILGITPVHTNRTLQALREADLVAFKGRRVSMPEPTRLRDFAGFTPNYLHLRRRESSVRAARRMAFSADARVWD